jgi:hypothetical protein
LRPKPVLLCEVRYVARAGISTAADVDRDIHIYAGLDGLHELLTQPDILQLYHYQFIDLINTVFAPQNFNPLVDQLLGDWVPKSMTDSIKSLSE